MKGTVLQLGFLIAGLAMASLPATARAESGAPAHLQLTLPQEQPKAPQVSLLQDSETLPASLHQAMLGEIAGEMSADLESFRSSLTQTAQAGEPGDGATLSG